MVANIVVTVNLLIALASGGVALVVFITPSFLLSSKTIVTAEAAFYAKFYAVRSLSLALMIAVSVAFRVPMWFTGFLFLGGLVQAGDAFIVANERNWRHALSPASAAAIHLLSALWLLAQP